MYIKYGQEINLFSLKFLIDLFFNLSKYLNPPKMVLVDRLLHLLLFGGRDCWNIYFSENHKISISRLDNEMQT